LLVVGALAEVPLLLQDRLRAGQLDESLAEAQDQVRKNPAQAEPRILLFQLQAVLGNWDKAFSQLNVLGDLDAKTLPMVQTYREALRCEGLRADVFAGRRSPLVFGEPEPWMAGLLSALQGEVKGEFQQAEALRAQALEAAPASSGSIRGERSARDGQRFTWLADADSRLGPMLELIFNGRYYWMPLHRIAAIRVDAPADLRDLVWLPAYVTLESGSELASLIPARYPGSETSSDSQLRLGRKTTWTKQGQATFIGLGQRVFASDGEDVALLDVREVTFDARAGAAVVPDAAAAAGHSSPGPG
jgi:type VI secretion system protein ImpE